MATVTDFLETVFVAKGIETYANAYDKAIKKNQQLTKENEKLVAKGKDAKPLVNPVTEALGAVTGGLTGPALAIQAIRVQLDFLNDSFREFAKAEDIIFRSTVVLNNLGTSLKPDALREMAKSLGDMAGIDDEAIVQAGTTLAQFGLSGKVTADALESIADAAAGTGMSMEQVTKAVARGSLGQTRGLLALGIQFKATGNKAQDFAAIMEEVNKRFAGAAEARKDTPAGAIDAMTVAIGNFKEAFGQGFAGVIIPLLNLATDALNFFTKNIGATITALNPIWGLITSLLPYKPSFGNIGKGGAGLATEEEQKKQTKALEKLSDSLVAGVLGGPGTVAKGAVTLRDVRLAFGS